MTALCPPCERMWLRWLDYRPPRRWLGNAYALDNPLARRMTIKAAVDEHYAFIRRQQAGIVADCRRKHGVEVTA